MEIPQEIRTYCPKCRAHTVHKLKQFKAGPPRKSMAWGYRKANRKAEGYVANKIRAHKGNPNYKQNKKPVFLATCTQCGRKHYFVIPKRMKRVELARV